MVFLKKGSVGKRVEAVLERHEALSRLMSDPKVFSNPSDRKKLLKEHAELSTIVAVYRDYEKVLHKIQEAEEILKDPRADSDLRELAQGELKEEQKRGEELEEHLTRLLLPKDPRDEKSVFLEIRAGTGGEEAALFAANLMRMYSRYAEGKGWKLELMSATPTSLHGFKEVILLAEGKGAYSRLKYESGVHRVQRIPVTEAGGRIHTSTVTVAVLPEAEEIDVHVDMKDLRVDTFCSSGPGGQSVNTTYSAVRITHLPTGLVVSCQDERSQTKNKTRAMRILRSRLLAMEKEKQQAEISHARRAQVGTGERSERIRTYNFPQNRVTDHRIGLTLYRLDRILEGDMEDIIEALMASTVLSGNGKDNDTT